jgi:hypothetical protein
MLTALERRLRRRGLAERVILRASSADDLGVGDLADSVDSIECRSRLGGVLNYYFCEAA